MTAELIPSPYFRKKVRKPIICDGYALLPLTKGKFAKIDVADIPLAADRNWQVSAGGGNRLYASAYVRYGPKKYGRVLLHRLLMGMPDLSVEIDHEDGDGLNNQRGNLRIATVSQNRQNRGPGRDNQLGVKGVYYSVGKGKYRVSIRAEGKTSHVGYFNTIDEAATAYNAAAKKFHGEFAWLNEV